VFTICHNLVQTLISFIRMRFRVSQFMHTAIKQASNGTLIRVRIMWLLIAANYWALIGITTRSLWNMPKILVRTRMVSFELDL
jgi:hypothetical protein